MTEKRSIDQLLSIMARLRDPEHGCPWDVQQDFDSIAAYTIEEAYEVADAIDRRDMDDLKDELGDLLLQVVFHARMAEEAGHFDFSDVAAAISDKMVRRHPHVFADASYADAEEQTRAWEAIKAAERKDKGEDDTSALAGIARGLPDYKRATKLQKRAAAVGFDWPDHRPVLDKLDEELDEVRAEFDQGGSTERLEDEIGDLLFVMVNLARHAKVDFSRALRRANLKFERRFRRMEAIAAAEGRPMADRDLADQEGLWQQVKREEREG
jgi:nucleoside triphosphate diphosphatase